MIRTRYGVVVETGTHRRGIQECQVICQGDLVSALNFDTVLGPLVRGETVLLNTTALHLGLGTGGYHLVMARSPQPRREAVGQGHIMKLRYTPWQLKVKSCEEPGSEGHQLLKESLSLDRVPVICCGLHSQVLACLWTLAQLRPALSVAYVFTDAGCLPVGLSRGLERIRKQASRLTVISAGHAFGGDLEAVNVHSGLLAARGLVRAEVILVGMGPGVTGTGTLMGHTEIRQAEDLNAVASLGGIPLAVPRISQEDERQRHQGVSHHSLVVLGRATLARCLVVMPRGPSRLRDVWKGQLEEWGVLRRHRILWLDPEAADAYLEETQLLETMGRGFSREPWFFRAAGLAALAGAQMAGGTDDI